MSIYCQASCSDPLLLLSRWHHQNGKIFPANEIEDKETSVENPRRFTRAFQFPNQDSELRDQGGIMMATVESETKKRTPVKPFRPFNTAFGCPREFLGNQFVYVVISPRAGG